MLSTNPICLLGPWNGGFALDFHTINSQYLGDDAYGHPQFDTTRTPIGELLYRLKYGSDKTAIKALGQVAAEFVENHNWNLNLIVPVPHHGRGAVFNLCHFLPKKLQGSWGGNHAPTALLRQRKRTNSSQSMIIRSD